jgi:hypothetical protein
LALSSTAAARSVEFPQTSEEDEEEKISSSSSKPQAGTVQAVESATRLEKVDPEEEEEAAAAVELSSSSAALPLPNGGMSNPFNPRTGTAPTFSQSRHIIMQEFLYPLAFLIASLAIIHL